MATSPGVAFPTLINIISSFLRRSTIGAVRVVEIPVFIMAPQHSKKLCFSPAPPNSSHGHSSNLSGVSSGLTFALQALLARHEAYMADASRDRMELTTRIEQLEMDKKELEACNARTIEDNRQLLDQLELLNGTVADSDVKIKTLEATLKSSQQAVRRLENAANRAEELERHIARLESEQLTLHSTLATSQVEARTALQRWRKAERGISELQAQLERIEREVEEERERHAEVLQRMERQRAMEKELDTAAGRLKGAAGARTMSSGGNGIVSHFVRDLLQDNANLQLGIAELREMLANSNDEIQALRDQLMFHQPLMIPGMGGGVMDAEPSLELELEHSPRFTSQELHIHHHYHVDTKKPARKRRSGLASVSFSPVNSTPSTPPVNPANWRTANMSPIPAYVHKDSVSTASGPSNRWSVFSEQPSEFALSSVPSSPQSNVFTSVFDRSMPADVPSEPTSPTTSVDPMSPTWRVAHRKRASDVSARSFAAPIPFRTSAPPRPGPPQLSTPQVSIISSSPTIRGLHSSPTTPPITDSEMGVVSHQPSLALAPVVSPPSADELPELVTPAASATEDDSSVVDTASAATDEDGAQPAIVDSSDEQDDDGEDHETTPRRQPSQRRPGTLHRSVSHESIMSLAGGLDIHTLKSRPSQLALRPLGAASASVAAAAVVSGVTVTATKTSLYPSPMRSPASNRGSLGLGLGLPMPRVASTPPILTMATTASIVTSATVTPNNPRLGLGRWVSPSIWRRPRGTPSATVVEEDIDDSAAIVVTPPTSNPSRQSNATAGSETDSLAESIPTASALATPSPTPAGTIRGSRSTTNMRAATAQQLTKSDPMRGPGINQPGAIPGFYEYWAARQQKGVVPSEVVPRTVDWEGLREGLIDS